MSAVVMAPELELKTEAYQHPQPRFTRVFANTGSQTVVIGSSGTAETIMQLPVKTWYPAKSYLEWQSTPTTAAIANTYNITHQVCEAMIQQIELYSAGGTMLAQVLNVNNYLAVVLPARTKTSEFVVRDAWTSKMYPCNSPGTPLTAIPNLRPMPAAASGIDRAYDEMTYLKIGSVAASALPVELHRLYFRDIIDTLFSLDKAFFLPEVINLRILWAPSIKSMYNTTTPTDPYTIHAADTLGITVGLLKFMMSVETDPLIDAGIRAEVASPSWSLHIPFVYNFKNNLTGTTQVVSIKISRSHGRRLRRIIHAPFDASESDRTSFDHCNATSATSIGALTTPGRRITSFYTMINNEKRTEYDINCLNYDDWELMQPSLKGSAIQSMNVYNYNWFWADTFDGLEDLERKLPHPKDMLETGLMLDVGEIKWDAYFNVPSSLANSQQQNHYTWVVTSKVISISGSTLMCA